MFAILNTVGSRPLKLCVIRNQKPVELDLTSIPFIATETANNANGFSKLIPTATKGATVTASKQVFNESLDVLTDGALSAGYGPAFTNGNHLGTYQMDVGRTQ